MELTAKAKEYNDLQLERSNLIFNDGFKKDIKKTEKSISNLSSSFEEEDYNSMISYFESINESRLASFWKERKRKFLLSKKTKKPTFNFNKQLRY